jgi:flagellar M-ring protein FliF
VEKALTVLKQLREFWAKLPTVKRVALLSVTTLVLASVLGVAVIGSKVSYGYLFTELTPEDATAISEKLKELKIPYRVEANGSAIMVPEERVHELRLDLAGSGLPRGGGVGFEIFDKAHFGATEFEQRVNLRRALEGELSRSIATIDGVQAARVHLVLPENRLFAAKSEGASASVVLKLRRGQEFGRAEVASIVHLVASAVPSLTRDRVSVVSTEGLTLHQPEAEETSLGMGRDDELLELTTKKEMQVRTLLERVVGPGKADVRVHLDLDTSARERTEEHYEPSKTALRSEQKTEEATGTQGTTVTGVPGAQSNLPNTEPAEPATEAALGGNVFHRSQTRNWEVDRVTQKTVTPAGNVARLSVAVLVDGVYEEKDGAVAYRPRSAEELAAFEALVKNAVGFDPARGDTIHVEGAQFAHLDDDIEPPPPPVWRKYAPVGAGGLGVVLLAAVALLALRGKRRKRVLAELKAAEVLSLEQAAAVPTAALEGAVIASLPSAEPEPLIDPRFATLEIVENDPATAAIVLRRWLNEDAIAATGETVAEARVM